MCISKICFRNKSSGIKIKNEAFKLLLFNSLNKWSEASLRNEYNIHRSDSYNFFSFWHEEIINLSQIWNFI